MLISMKRIPRFAFITGMLLVVLFIVYSTIYAIEKPGGIADWRLSRATGQKDTLRIPLEQTSEEAIRQFRGTSSLAPKVILQEPIHGGMLQFSKRMQNQSGSDLQVEKARKTWLGWKWITGGGYSFGGDKMDASSDSALSYMMMPANLGKPKGDSILFGEIGDRTITHIVVRADKDGAKEYEAKIVKTDEGYVVWYMVLPASIGGPIEMQAYTDENELRARQMITIGQESGTIRGSSIR